MSSIPSSALLSAISGELAAMVETVESLSAMVGDHVAQSRGDARLSALRNAQSIDDLSQRLDALSGVTGAMARGDDAEIALAGVRLADLVQRLRGSIPTTISAPGPHSGAPSVAGDLMLFE